MKRCLVFLFVLFGWVRVAQANADNIMLEENVLLMANHVERILHQTASLMRRSGDLLRNDGGMNDVVLQSTLTGFTDQVSAVRALLFIDPNGILRLDTTRHPAAHLDLSKRRYFTDTINLDNSNLHIAEQVWGKQSGLPFIPVTSQLRDQSGSLMGVFVAVMTPETWLPSEQSCHLCFYSAFTTSGQTIMTAPAQIELADDFFETLFIQDDLSGLAVTRLNTYPAQTMWRRLRYFPVVVTSSVVTIY